MTDIELAPVTLKAHRGRAKTIEVTVVDVDADGNQTPRDISGDSFEWTLSHHPDDSAILVTKTDGAGLTKTDSAGGKLRIVMEGADNDLAPRGYYHELHLTAADGRPYTAMTGPYRILRAQVRV